VIEGLGVDWIDAEGRFLQLDVGNLSVVSLYLPSGSSSDERQQVKFQFLDVFMPHLEQLKAAGRDIVICGDWNIAHQKST
jgi:exodeoxyribonuclease-3